MNADSDREPQANWRDRASYAYTQQLTRDAWSWELLRRSPAYHAAWRAAAGGQPRNRPDASAAPVTPSVRASADPARWGLLCFRGSRAIRDFRRRLLAAKRFCFRLPGPRRGGERRLRLRARHRVAPLSDNELHDARRRAPSPLRRGRPPTPAPGARRYRSRPPPSLRGRRRRAGPAYPSPLAAAAALKPRP